MRSSPASSWCSPARSSDQDGKLVVKKGEVMPDKEIDSINFYVKGITKRCPASEGLARAGQDAPRLGGASGHWPPMMMSPEAPDFFFAIFRGVLGYVASFQIRHLRHHDAGAQTVNPNIKVKII